MKSMKSVKAFLFCVAAILTVMFAIAVSKPNNNIRTDADKASDTGVNYNSHTVASEDSASFFSETDLSESEEAVSDEHTEATESESAANSYVSEKEGAENSKTPPSTVSKTENTTKNPTTAAPRPTEKTTASQAPKETATRKSTATAPVQAEENEQMTVYYTKTGKRYHYENPCGNGNFSPTTLAEAKKMGLTPCQKCVLH